MPAVINGLIALIAAGISLDRCDQVICQQRSAVLLRHISLRIICYGVVFVRALSCGYSTFLTDIEYSLYALCITFDNISV
jgi:hypothetical protein